MPSPFPGMDPWLESPLLWPGVHARLIPLFAEQLAPQVIPAGAVDCYGADTAKPRKRYRP